MKGYAKDNVNWKTPHNGRLFVLPAYCHYYNNKHTFVATDLTRVQHSSVLF